MFYTINVIFLQIIMGTNIKGTKLLRGPGGIPEYFHEFFFIIDKLVVFFDWHKICSKDSFARWKGFYKLPKLLVAVQIAFREILERVLFSFSKVYFFQFLQFSLEDQSWSSFFSLDLFIIAFLNSFVINGALFPLTIFSFRSACLFTIAL